MARPSRASIDSTATGRSSSNGLHTRRSICSGAGSWQVVDNSRQLRSHAEGRASMIRAFVAVQLSEPLRTTLAAVQSEVKRRITHDVSRDVSLSWVRPASMHLTVKFLGDIAEDLVMHLHEAIADTIVHHRVLQIPLDRLGVFPRPQQPRVLWIA